LRYHHGERLNGAVCRHHTLHGGCPGDDGAIDIGNCHGMALLEDGEEKTEGERASAAMLLIIEMI
jgi:hypothetical protein